MIADCDAAGLAAIAKGRTWSVATSDEIVLEVDLVQYDTGEGPCLDAIHSSHVVRLDIADGRETYPHFAPGALDAGIRSVLSIPVAWDGTTVGALNLYSKREHAFQSEEARTTAEQLAGYAAETILTSPLYETSQALVEEVIAGLGTAEMVGAALGILCAQAGYGRPEALTDLAESARLRGETLREAAEWVLRENDIADRTDAGGESRTES
jgi:GAF domain-containing protein